MEQAQAIKRVLAQDRSRRPLPQLTWQDISVLESVNKALKPVADFTDILSGEKYVTVSSLVPMLGHLEGVLERCEEDTELTANLKRVVMEQMERRYEEPTQRMLRKATFLDPRYRGDHMSPPLLDSTKSDLIEELVADNTTQRNTRRPDTWRRRGSGRKCRGSTQKKEGVFGESFREKGGQRDHAH